MNEYEDSLVMKLFGFMFCNSYGSFFYLAFVGQPLMGIDCERRCMDLLATNLTIVLGVQLVVRGLPHSLPPAPRPLLLETVENERLDRYDLDLIYIHFKSPCFL